MSLHCCHAVTISNTSQATTVAATFADEITTLNQTLISVTTDRVQALKGNYKKNYDILEYRNLQYIFYFLNFFTKRIENP